MKTKITHLQSGEEVSTTKVVEGKYIASCIYKGRDCMQLGSSFLDAHEKMATLLTKKK